MSDFLSGALVTLSIAVAAFQLRFWRRSNDRLFAFFGAAFLLMALNRAALFALDDASETRTYFYLLRFVAFVLIIVAIVDKNRRARR